MGTGHRPEQAVAGAEVLENASRAGVVMGVRGQGLCWFEAGKLTVKFHCCLRKGMLSQVLHPHAKEPPHPVPGI